MQPPDPPEADPPAAPADPDPAAASAVGALRAAWEPHKRRLAAADPHHPTNIRIHRACSWLQAAEEAPAEATDERMLFGWIALNALYGRWDAGRAQALPEKESFRAFFAELLAIDADERIPALLEEHKRLVLVLVDNSFLQKTFWNDPSIERAGFRTKHRQNAQQDYANGRHDALLDRAIEPVWFLRCQLAHGTATRRSGLNRDGLRHAEAFLALLVPALVRVMITHGMDADWGRLCYPPQ